MSETLPGNVLQVGENLLFIAVLLLPSLSEINCSASPKVISFYLFIARWPVFLSGRGISGRKMSFVIIILMK